MNWMYVALAALAVALIVSLYRWLSTPSERQMNPVGYSVVSDQEEEEIELSLRQPEEPSNKPTRKPQSERRQASRPRSKP